MAALTCIVVAFHRPNELDLLLRGLRHVDIALLVVNVENDPTIENLCSHQLVRVLNVPYNCGYAVAVNAALQFAESESVVFMNDDVQADAESLLSLAAQVKPGHVDVVVPRVVDETGMLERTILALPTVRNLAVEWLCLPDRPIPAFRRILSVEKWRNPIVREPIVAASACCVAVSRSLMREYPLPEIYFLYWEELEWFFRLHGAGKRVWLDPKVEVRHAGGRGDLRPAKAALLARNAVRCVRRTQGRHAAAAAYTIVILWTSRLLLLSLVRGVRSHDGEEIAARIGGFIGALKCVGEVW